MRAETILILGNENDEHAVHMHNHLRRGKHDVELLNSQWFPEAMKLSLHIPSERGVISLPNGRTLDFSDVKSVYWRGYDGVGAVGLPDQEQAWIAHNDARGLFESLLILLPARWVNGWDAFWLHQTKPVQLTRVAALGVRIAPTLIANDPSAVKGFASDHPQSIVKPVQGGDHAARLQPAHLSKQNLDQLRLAPITVQAEVQGTNIRAFVAGEFVLACEVRTSELDYREDPSPELIVHDLPLPIADMSRRIARTLQLLWTGIDFRLTPDGQYVFLEANPSPMFLGFERQTGLPLTDRLADLLVDS